MVFFCLSEDCFSSNHSLDGHLPIGIMEAHHSGGSRDYHQTRNSSIHSKGPAPSMPPHSTGQSSQMQISMSQSAISSQFAPPAEHKAHFSSSQDLDDRHNERYSSDSCSKQMGLQIGLQPKSQNVSNPFHTIAENESELSVTPMPPTPRPLQRHYSVVDPKSFGNMGRNLPGKGGWPIGFESAIAGMYHLWSSF